MLAELIHPIAAMDHQEWEFRPRPSNGGPDTCLRKLTYQAFEAPQKDQHGRFLVVLDDSSWHEELVVQWLERTVFHLHSRQLRIPCGTTIWKGQPQTINGQIDGIITDLFGIDQLLEIKAIEHFTFQRYEDGAYPTNDFTQVVFYITGVCRPSDLASRNSGFGMNAGPIESSRWPSSKKPCRCSMCLRSVHRRRRGLI